MARGDAARHTQRSPLLAALAASHGRRCVAASLLPLPALARRPVGRTAGSKSR
jgi:hypothetical protein